MTIRLGRPGAGSEFRGLTGRDRRDSLKYCEDLWWYYCEADSRCGLVSSMSAQACAAMGAPMAHDATETDPRAAARLRRIYASLALLTIAQRRTLAAWYTSRGGLHNEIAVASAHRSYYSGRDGKR